MKFIQVTQRRFILPLYTLLTIASFTESYAGEMTCPATLTYDLVKKIRDTNSGVVQDGMTFKSYDQAALKKNLPISGLKFKPVLLRKFVDKDGQVICQYNFASLLRKTLIPFDVIITPVNSTAQPNDRSSTRLPDHNNVNHNNTTASSNHETINLDKQKADALIYFGFKANANPQPHDMIEAHLEKLEKIENLARTNPSLSHRQLEELQRHWNILRKLYNLN